MRSTLACGDHHDDDVFTVRLVAEDVIVGSQVRRFERMDRPVVKNDHLGPLQAERMESALRRARLDLLVSRPDSVHDD